MPGSMEKRLWMQMQPFPGIRCRTSVARPRRSFQPSLCLPSIWQVEVTLSSENIALAVASFPELIGSCPRCSHGRTSGSIIAANRPSMPAKVTATFIRPQVVDALRLAQAPKVVPIIQLPVERNLILAFRPGWQSLEDWQKLAYHVTDIDPRIEAF